MLVVVNVPARLLAKPLESQNWPLAAFALLATAASLSAPAGFSAGLGLVPQRQQLTLVLSPPVPLIRALS